MNKESSVIEQPTTCPSCRPRRWLNALVLIAAIIWGFIGGQLLERRHFRHEVYESGRLQFLEFLRIGTSQGFVTVDMAKLVEVIRARESDEMDDDQQNFEVQND